MRLPLEMQAITTWAKVEFLGAFVTIGVLFTLTPDVAVKQPNE
jgi:hypothetical protein